MVYTYKNLRDQVLRLIDEVGDTGTTLDIVKDLMNQAHQLRCSSRPWQFMQWDNAVTLATTAGTYTYALHQEFGRPKFFKDESTGQFLEEVANRELDDRNLAIPANEVDTGEYDTLHFYFSGTSAVLRQPAAATTITAVSTSASDTGGTTYQVVIKGELADGSVAAEVLTLTGTTPVTTTLSFQKINGVTKNQNFIGTLTVATTTDALTLVSLLPWEMGRQYQTITFIEDPGTRTVTYRFFRQPLALVNDYDVPDLRSPYCQVLVWDTLLLLGGGYLTDISSSQLAMWQEQAAKWEFALNSLELTSQSLGSRPSTINTRRLEG
jgi:hypothetical protein